MSINESPNNTQILKIRPYARLLTMLGEQLIKNERIAIIELVKNSYDADANWAQVRFVNFDKQDDENLLVGSNSYIEIEDDGEGMTLSIIKDAWMNPATPIKYLAKQGKDEEKKRTKKHKRIIQGDKGIGRFAVLKLGSTVEIVTRSVDNNKQETIVISDFSRYDDDFIKKDGEEKDIYLDDLEVECVIRDVPKDIIEKDITIQGIKKKRQTNGTIIRISNLKKKYWTRSTIQEIFNDILKIGFPFGTKDKPDEFTVDIVLNSETIFDQSEIEEKLTDYFDRAPLRVTNGTYDDNTHTIHFNLNNSEMTLNLKRLVSIKEFRDRFCRVSSIERYPQCGPFRFEFFIFDLTSNAPPKYRLTQEEKKTIRNNRIYLYRDGIRVYPYGDPDDDWLRIDALRGVGRAGDYLSMDQTVGYVEISQERNPDLKDKTNREGLLEIGEAFSDFRALLQSIMGFLRKEYSKYKSVLDVSQKEKNLQQSMIEQQLSLFSNHLKEIGDSQGIKSIKTIAKTYSKEKQYLIDRAETSEDLAAVGLSVEMASHDIMLLIGRAKDTLDLSIKMSDSKDLDIVKLNDNLQKMRGQLTFVEDQIHIIQPIFKSSKRPRKDQRVRKSIDDVKKYFDEVLLRNNIDAQIEEVGPPIIVNCTDAVLLQAFINLFDNAIYWLNTIDITSKQIRILINGESYEVLFADNGPGVWDDDIPYIFNQFFSTKGLEGRGLGLYIARQLLERFDFQIDYIKESKRKILAGANFLINFSQQTEG